MRPYSTKMEKKKKMLFGFAISFHASPDISGLGD
jgi:hypothetical protein